MGYTLDESPHISNPHGALSLQSASYSTQGDSIALAEQIHSTASMDILPILMELRMSKVSSREASDSNNSTSNTTKSSSRPSSAALTVLTNPTLWRHITSCMSGWPHLALQFRQQVISKASRGTTAVTTTGTPKHPLPLHSETLTRLVDGVITENDDRVLKMLYELVKNSPNQVEEQDDDTKRAFSGAMATALRFRRFEMLTWIRDAAASEPEWWHWDPDLMEHALCSRDLELVTWLYNRFPNSRSSS